MTRTYGRLVSFDERSRGYPIRALVEGRQPRSYVWVLDLRLDQGREGSCAGMAVTYEAAADPVPVVGLTEADARAVYYRARELDDQPGENYEGTSVLAAMKAGVERGWYSEYRWAFGLDDLILALGWQGPAVLGLNWYEGMEEVDGTASVFVHPTGPAVGGHAICANGVDVEGERVMLTNSWGSNWGWHGVCWISFADLDRLLHEQGEAAVPVVRLDPGDVL